jgi:hypothetical protein
MSNSRNQSKCRCTMLIVIIFLFYISATAKDSVKKTIPFELVKKIITAEIYQPDFLFGDSQYTGMISASDGKIYFSIGTHKNDYAARFYSFDPATKKVTLIAKVDEIVGEDSKKQFSNGKIHTRMFEHKGKIWFATHTSFYSRAGLPGTEYNGKQPYQGGHFMNYDLSTGKFTDLAQIFCHEGIITLTMDKKNEMLYGLTWPSGILVSYDINQDDLRYWGAVQHRGEWGHHPTEWEMICRTMSLDPNGCLYGSTMNGQIWKFDPTQDRTVSYIKGLDLKHVPFTQSAEATLKGDFKHNWRTIEWNPKTNSFWGLHFETATLFEFDPATNFIRAVSEIGHEDYHGMPRNPEVGQLGFTLGPKNTLFYLAHGPAVVMKGRENTQSSLFLMTYNIDERKLINHGPIFSPDKRRVFFAESIAIGKDDHIYTVAWIEVADPERKKALTSARTEGSPAETKGMVYEMLLVRLPQWQTFLN